MSLIQGTGGGLGGAGAPGGSLGSFYSHLLDQSLKFNDDDSQYLTRTPTTTGNRKTWTFSCWLKGASFASSQTIFSTSQNYDSLRYTTTGKFMLLLGNSSSNLQTTALFRDPSAWYNLVVAVDTTQSTSTDRVKFYVNGSQVTSFSTSTYPSLNYDTGFNYTSYSNAIGRRQSTSSLYWDSYLAEINMIDGTALDASSFGETKNGIWIPKDTSGLTFGTNGFHLTFKDDVVSEGFNTVAYAGTAGTQSISGVGFAPDWVWIKKRATAGHVIQDTVRGSFGYIQSNATSAENTTSGNDWFRSFDADGFTVSDTTTSGSATSEWNDSGENYVAWCWEAGGTPTANNSAGVGYTPTAGSVKIDGSNLGSALAGTIPATKISANTARGFSIVGYEATGSAGTIAHGLSAAPEFIIVKHRDQSSTSWPVYYGDNTDVLYLNDTAATTDDANAWNDTSPTSTVFSVGANGGDTNNSLGGSTVAYCFHSVSGYSSIGSYSGNGSSTGPTVTLGFRPAWVMFKRTDDTGNWFIVDTTRNPSNPLDLRIYSNLNNAESAADSINVTDTGFEIVASFSDINASGGTYIYMAFADTREAAFFKDVSTNGNHFTPVNLDYRDSIPDVPTNNFATLNPLSKGSGTVTFSEGNLKSSTSVSLAVAEHGATFTIPKSGKWYWEAAYTGANTGGSVAAIMGIMDIDTQTVGVSGNHLTTTTGDYVSYYTHNSAIYENNVLDSSFSGNEAAATVGFALDIDNGYLFVHLNGTYIGGTPNFSTGANHAAEPNTTRTWLPFFGANGGGTITWTVNFGQDSSFAGTKATDNSNTDDSGHGSFAYAPPSGYLALCSQNLPDVDIIDGSENFNTVLYTGNAGTQSITGVGFDPDLTWAKNRTDDGYHHELYDTVRGDNKRLFSSQADAEATGYLQFISDGFSLTAGGGINTNSKNHVAWNWKSGGATPEKTYVVKVVSDGGNKYRFDDFGTSAVTLNLQEGGTYTFDQSDSSNDGHPLRFSTTSNGTHGGGSEYTTGVTTTGTPGNAGAKTVITVAASAATLYYYCTQHSGMGGQANTNSTFGSTHLEGSVLSTVSANTTAGFSILEYTGTGSAVTVAHGLSAAPELILSKNRDDGDGWNVYHSSLGASAYLYLNSSGTGETGVSYPWNGTAPTSSVFSTNSAGSISSEKMIAYCFHSVEGYSKVGSYIGNGANDGAFVYTGFRPAWTMIKRAVGGTDHWVIDDVVRSPTNEMANTLYADLSNNEYDGSLYGIDFVSNGFKIRDNDGNYNANGNTYIYLAFAESPFKFANAR